MNAIGSISSVKYLNPTHASNVLVLGGNKFSSKRIAMILTAESGVDACRMGIKDAWEHRDCKKAILIMEIFSLFDRCTKEQNGIITIPIVIERFAKIILYFNIPHDIENNQDKIIFSIDNVIVLEINFDHSNINFGVHERSLLGYKFNTLYQIFNADTPGQEYINRIITEVFVSPQNHLIEVRSENEIEALEYFIEQKKELDSLLKDLKNAQYSADFLTSDSIYEKMCEIQTEDQFVIAELAILMENLSARRIKSASGIPTEFVFLPKFYSPEISINFFKRPTYYNNEQARLLHLVIIDHISKKKEIVVPIIVDTSGQILSEHPENAEFTHRVVIFIHYNPNSNKLRALYVNSVSKHDVDVVHENAEITDSFLSELYQEAIKIDPSIEFTHMQLNTGSQGAHVGCSFFSYNALKKLTKEGLNADPETIYALLQENSQSSQEIKKRIQGVTGNNLREVVDSNQNTILGSTAVTKRGENILDTIRAGLIDVEDKKGKHKIYNMGIFEQRLKEIGRILNWMSDNPGKYEEVCQKRTDVNTLFKNSYVINTNDEESKDNLQGTF